MENLRNCIYWLSSTDDLDYANDNLYTANNYFKQFCESHEKTDFLKSVEDDFKSLSQKFNDLYDDIYSLIVNIHILEDGQAGVK